MARLATPLQFSDLKESPRNSILLTAKKLTHSCQSPRPHRNAIKLCPAAPRHSRTPIPPLPPSLASERHRKAPAGLGAPSLPGQSPSPVAPAPHSLGSTQQSFLSLTLPSVQRALCSCCPVCLRAVAQAGSMSPRKQGCSGVQGTHPWATEGLALGPCQVEDELLPVLSLTECSHLVGTTRYEAAGFNPRNRAQLMQRSGGLSVLGLKKDQEGLQETAGNGARTRSQGAWTPGKGAPWRILICVHGGVRFELSGSEWKTNRPGRLGPRRWVFPDCPRGPGERRQWRRLSQNSPDLE